MRLKILSGSSHRTLSENIATSLGLELVKCNLSKYHDGECRVEILDNLRGYDVYVIQSTCPPVNEHVMELLILLDALSRASVSRITAVIPYYGYGRHDQSTYDDHSRHSAISSKLIADLIKTAGADRVLTLDLNTPESQGFFDVPVDNLSSESVLLDYLGYFDSDCCIVAPNLNGVKKVQKLAQRARVEGMVYMDKDTDDTFNIIGDVREKAFIFVSVIGSGRTITMAAKTLRENGAKQVYVLASHGIFSGNALELIEKSPIDQILVTDSISQDQNVRNSTKIGVATLVGLFSEAIRRLYNNEPLDLIL